MKHIIIRLAVLTLYGLRLAAYGLWWLVVVIGNPFLVILKWIFRPVVLFSYSWYLKIYARLRRSAFMQNKVLFIFGNKYFIHVMVVLITVFVTSTNLLQAKEVQTATFGKKSSLYTLVNPAGEIGEDIIETGLISKAADTVTYIDTAGTLVATIPNLDPKTERRSAVIDQLAVLESGSALVSNSVLETGVGIRSSITEYEVRSGDSVGSIAERFGLSVRTILWANNLSASSYIKPGDTIKILPASGITHIVKDGDTLDKIIEKYKGNLEETIKINDIGADHVIPVGTEIVVVDGTPPPPPPPPVQSYFANYSNTSNLYYNQNLPAGPITGQKLNWPVGCNSSPSTYWGHIARDISCPMGTAVYAAESGTAYIRNAGGWGGGYGNYIDVVHGNGMTTRYAHLSGFNISSGQGVSRGQVIGFVGSTGRSSGPHLHFEVIIGGIKYDPISYIR